MLLTKRSRKQGFTLLELLITMALSLLLSLLLVSAFSQTSSAIDLGTAKTTMQTATRTAIDRMTPLVMSASANGGLDAVERPAAGLGVDTMILFNTTEDFLAPGYDVTAAFDITDPPRTYAITHDNVNNQLILQRWNRVLNAPDPTVEPRRLAIDITGFETVRLFTHSIEVRVTAQEDVRRANRTTETAIFTATAVLQVPTEAP